MRYLIYVVDLAHPLPSADVLAMHVKSVNDESADEAEGGFHQNVDTLVGACDLDLAIGCLSRGI